MEGLEDGEGVHTAAVAAVVDKVVALAVAPGADSLDLLVVVVVEPRTVVVAYWEEHLPKRREVAAGFGSRLAADQKSGAHLRHFGQLHCQAMAEVRCCAVADARAMLHRLVPSACGADQQGARDQDLGHRHLDLGSGQDTYKHERMHTRK